MDNFHIDWSIPAFDIRVLNLSSNEKNEKATLHL